jgi:DNA-binding response OmpR family regulator
MLTAQSGTEDVFRANAAGANGYLVKPFDLVELFDEIEKALSVKARG